MEEVFTAPYSTDAAAFFIFYFIFRFRRGGSFRAPLVAFALVLSAFPLAAGVYSPGVYVPHLG